MDVLKDNFLRVEGTYAQPKIYFPKNNTTIKKYYETMIDSINYIKEHKTKKINLFLSGGQDSAFVFKLLCHLNINFNTVIVKTHNDRGDAYNLHDIKYAFELCQEHNIEPIVINYNFDHFVKSGKILEISNSYGCYTSSQCWHLDVSSLIDGCNLFCGNFVRPDYDKDTNSWTIRIGTSDMGMIKFFKENNIEGSPMFMIYSIDNFYSILNNEAVFDFMKLDNDWARMVDGSYHAFKSHIFNDNPFFKLKEYDYSDFTSTNIIVPNNINKYVKFHGAEIYSKSEIWQHQNLRILYENQKLYDGKFKLNYKDFINNFVV